MKTHRAILLTILKAAALSLLTALSSAAASAQQIPEAKLTPEPSTEKQTATIREGVALHDRGDYDGAIRKYEEVLAENPSNVLALYEMSYSYAAKKDYNKSIELARRGAQYKSDQLTGFYVLLGNDYDLLGQTDRAIEVYKRGIKLFPNAGALHFNLGVAYKNAGRLDEAKKSFKTSLVLNPQHPGSNLLLAAVFYGTGYRVPALLAASRFLALEQKGERADAALKIMRDVLGGGATPGSKPNEITINLDLNAKKDEGDFGAVDLALGLSGAVDMTEKDKDKGRPKTEAERIVSQMDMLITMLDEGGKKKQTTFVFQYYVPYFLEMKRQGFVEAFVYNALQSTGLPGVREWVDSNSGRVMQFLLWNKNYQWPSNVKI
jgi:tetratricopeptide (TPR) repeat protein